MNQIQLWNEAEALIGSLQYTVCPKFWPIEDFVYLAKYGKFVANAVFPIVNVGIPYLGWAVTALHSLHISNKKLQWGCQGVVRERQVQHEIGIVNEIIVFVLVQK